MACTHVFLSELLLIRLTKTHVRRRIYPTPTVRNSLTEDPPFLESLEFLRFAVFTSFATFADGRKSTQGISCWKVSVSKRFRQNSKSPFLAKSIFPFAKIANQIGKVVNTAINVPFFRQLGVRRNAAPLSYPSFDEAGVDRLFLLGVVLAFVIFFTALCTALLMSTCFSPRLWERTSTLPLCWSTSTAATWALCRAGAVFFLRKKLPVSYPVVTLVKQDVLISQPLWIRVSNIQHMPCKKGKNSHDPFFICRKNVQDYKC